jgi:predicted nucleic acid-binding protein
LEGNARLRPQVVKIVIDASVALAWCYADERTSESTKLLEYVNTHGAVVPQLWHLEVANALIVGEIRNRITYAIMVGQLQHLSELPIQIDHSTAGVAWHSILSIAREERLTTYDAAYVDLAIRLNLPLASRDTAMIRAAKNLGVEIIEF